MFGISCSSRCYTRCGVLFICAWFARASVQINAMYSTLFVMSVCRLLMHMNSSTDKKQSFKNRIKQLYQACPKWAKAAYIIFLFINLFLLFASFGLDDRCVLVRGPWNNSKLSQWAQISPYRYLFPFSYTVAINNGYVSNGPSLMHPTHSSNYGIIRPFDIVAYDITDFLLYTLTSLVCMVICLLIINPLSIRHKERT